MSDDPRPHDGEPPLSDAAILAGIEAVAREHLDIQQALPLTTRLVEELQLDSVRLLTLAIEVENRFRICLDDGGELAVETVADLVAAVRRALAAEAGTAPGGPNPLGAPAG
jgi:acyl carrier protein